MNIRDELMERRNSIYRGFVPKLSKEIFKLLKCYDEFPYVAISNPELFSLSYGKDGFCVVLVKATYDCYGYKIFLDTGRDHAWEEITYFPLLCAVFDSLSFMRVYQERKCLAETVSHFDENKLRKLDE